MDILAIKNSNIVEQAFCLLVTFIKETYNKVSWNIQNDLEILGFCVTGGTFKCLAYLRHKVHNCIEYFTGVNCTPLLLVFCYFQVLFQSLKFIYAYNFVFNFVSVFRSIEFWGGQLLLIQFC